MELHPARPLRIAIMIALALLWAGSATAQESDIARAKALDRQVTQLYREGRYGDATPVAKEQLASLEKAIGPEHIEVATGLNNLATLYIFQARYAKAEPLYRRSLAIREKVLGPEHPDVANSLSNLAA